MTTIAKTPDRVDAILRACRLMLRMNRARPDARKSEILYYEMLINYCSQLATARQDGKFIAAHTVFFPSEILYAMDIVPMHTETISWMTALFLGQYADLLAAGAEQGLSSEICSPHRGLAGALSIRALPRPDVVLWSNMVCDNTAKCGELLMKITGSPGFFLDRPFQQSEEEMAYFIEELQGMIRFLEDRSGRKMNWDKLSETVRRMDEQIELFREINRLREAIPSPFRPQGFLELVTVDYLFTGRPEATEYLQTLRDELAAAVAERRGAVPKERYRMMTLFMPPMYLIGFLDRLSREYGAVSVTEPFFCNWGEGRLDPARALESVARKSYMLPEARLFGPLSDNTVADIVESAKRYNVDGAIYYADVGCRHTCATIKLFKDALSEIDVPLLTIDCDVVDPTVTSEGEVREKLERFFELLDDRK
ncbi:MAG: 2-hydroxyacyl-CoA dehydratase family protein [Dehalococcoidia bacterium]|nr:2-hydroxyacyl-CoA dehydratase family protein [Dehalococcoidia bacterium]